MACAGAIGADGGSEIIVWPRGQRRPSQHSHRDGLTLFIEPACVGCKADDACPFFPAYASQLRFPCTSGVPPGERVDQINSHLTRFEDPPGVAGDGFPSGGQHPAIGLVGIKGSLRTSVVFRTTCTLSANQHSVCAASLNDMRGRYG